MALTVKDAAGAEIEPGDTLVYLSGGKFVSAEVKEVRFRKTGFELKVAVRGSEMRRRHDGTPFNYFVSYNATLRKTSAVFKVGPNGVTITLESLSRMTNK